MKKLLCVFALTLAASNIQAADFFAPEYYSAKFEIESVRPMCPRTIPRGAVCMGIGSIVTLKATLGCGDQLVFSEIEADTSGSVADIYTASVVKKHPKSRLIRCIRANEVRKTITLPSAFANPNVINVSIESI